MPTETVDDTTQPPPTITATSHITGLRDIDVTQLEHDQMAITWISGGGGQITISGPPAELLVANAEIDRQIRLLLRSGPEF